jgi:uncharacterized integral membrane protein (TIGR00698 family)
MSVQTTRVMAVLPGLAAAVLCAALAKGLAAISPVPAMVTALTLGLVWASVRSTPALAPGIDVAVKPLLRLGVALLGAQLTLPQLLALGWSPILLAVVCVLATVLAGAWIGRACGLSPVEAWISATSVGICGASAALAASSVLPRSEASERVTLLTVAGANLLSTVAMVGYPLLGAALGWSLVAQGVLFGLTIHDVAQVVGAGAIAGGAAVATAALVKLVRVALLAPVVVGLGLWARRHAAEETQGALPPLVPGFLIGFGLLAAAASAGLIPPAVADALKLAASWLLTVAVAALGLKTSIRVLIGAQRALGLAMVLQSLLILSLGLAGVWLSPSL